jgi:hypothetical protein
MSETIIEAGIPGSEQSPITIFSAEGEGQLSLTNAARALANARKTKEQADERRAASEPVQEPTAKAEGAAPPEQEARGEAEGADRERSPDQIQGQLPPIEPPRSWTKEDKELFTSLPRETQERLAERERSRESDFLRRQNEAADKLKGLTAKEQAVELARQQYEAALPQLLVMLQQQQAGEFADIKTLADVERLAREDWPRYALWDVQQKKIAEVSRQLMAAQQRQTQEQLQQFSDFANKEDALFKEKVPDMADAKRATELQTACLTALKDLGFAEAELAQSWNGRKDLSLRDHRVQLLVRDATLWREAQQKAKAAAAKPVPPVQRPGVAQPKGGAQEAQIQNLTQQLEHAKGVNAIRLAAQLTAAKRAARR